MEATAQAVRRGRIGTRSKHKGSITEGWRCPFLMEDRWISRALKERNGLIVRLARCEEYTIVLDRTVESQIGQMRRLVLGLFP
jgi:hypothetical protein